MAEGAGTALLLANTIATGAALVALILAFGPVSGAHFNPAVTVADASQGGLRWADAGAYWFTASTSFANPAVTLARSATDTFAGIRGADVPGFVIAQIVGAACATLLFRWLTPALPAVAEHDVVSHERVRV